MFSMDKNEQNQDERCDSNSRTPLTFCDSKVVRTTPSSVLSRPAWRRWQRKEPSRPSHVVSSGPNQVYVAKPSAAHSLRTLLRLCSMLAASEHRAGGQAEGTGGGIVYRLRRSTDTATKLSRSTGSSLNSSYCMAKPDACDATAAAAAVAEAATKNDYGDCPLPPMVARY